MWCYKNEVKHPDWVGRDTAAPPPDHNCAFSGHEWRHMCEAVALVCGIFGLELWRKNGRSPARHPGWRRRTGQVELRAQDEWGGRSLWLRQHCCVFSQNWWRLFSRIWRWRLYDHHNFCCSHSPNQKTVIELFPDVYANIYTLMLTTINIVLFYNTFSIHSVHHEEDYKVCYANKCRTRTEAYFSLTSWSQHSVVFWYEEYGRSAGQKCLRHFKWSKQTIRTAKIRNSLTLKHDERGYVSLYYTCTFAFMQNLSRLMSFLTEWKF